MQKLRRNAKRAHVGGSTKTESKWYDPLLGSNNTHNLQSIIQLEISEMRLIAGCFKNYFHLTPVLLKLQSLPPAIRKSTGFSCTNPIIFQPSIEPHQII